MVTNKGIMLTLFGKQRSRKAPIIARIKLYKNAFLGPIEMYTRRLTMFADTSETYDTSVLTVKLPFTFLSL